MPHPVQRQLPGLTHHLQEEEQLEGRGSYQQGQCLHPSVPLHHRLAACKWTLYDQAGVCLLTGGVLAVGDSPYLGVLLWGVCWGPTDLKTATIFCITL